MRAAEIQNLITNLVNGIGKNDLLNLTPGKVITALIKEVQGDNCTLIIDGKEISARLETDLPAGQSLKLFVEGEKNGQIVLKLLSNSPMDNEISLKNIVGRLGLNENMANIKLIGEMVKQQMPLTPALASKLSGFIKSINIPEPDLWIPVFMENNGIKLTQQNYTRVTGLLTDLRFFNDDLKMLSERLHNFIKAAQPQSELVETAQKVVDILKGLKLDPNQGKETLTAKLELAVRLLTETKPNPEAVELGFMLEKLALNLKESNAGEKKEIIRLIQNVTEKIEFVRNFNIQTEAGRENMMVFYSTVQFEDRNEPLRLVLKHREGKGKRNSFSNCRLEIRLNTPGLGAVKCEVQVVNKNLTLQFITTSDSAGRALDLFAEVLAERLSKMEYFVDYLPSRVEAEREHSLTPESGTGTQALFQLDLTI